MPLIQKVKADEFYNSGGSIGECKFASMVGIQYNDIGGNGVQWDNANVRGVSGNWIQSVRTLDIADITYPDAHRYPNMADVVAVPPNTRVEFGYWAWNYTGHDVTVDTAVIFTSRADPNNGDLTQLGAGGSYVSVGMNGFPTRSGKAINAYPGTYGVRTNDAGRIVYSFNTIQPVQLQSFNATPIWSGANLSVRYDMVLRNVSTYNLCNIRVRDVMPSGAVYDQSHCINSGQSITVSYSENWGTSYPASIINDPATIWDNNSHTESPNVTMPNIYDGGNAESRPAVAMRDDSNAPAGWNASQPTWGQITNPPMEVTLIPYWFNSGSTQLDLTPNVSIHKTVSDADETNVKTNTSVNRENITYNVSVQNTGGRTLNVNVLDDYDQNYITITNSNGGVDNGDTITWTIPALEHDQTVNYTVQAKIKDLAHGNYTFKNSAKTTNPETPPDETTTNVNARATITLDKRVTDSDENNVNANTVQGDHYSEDERHLTFNINYTNTGDADATGVVLIDNLSEFSNAGLLNRVENISNGGVYDSNTHIITWNISNLGDGESGSVSFEIYLNRSGDIDRNLTNTTTIDSNETAPVTDMTNTTILTPELVINKTDNKDTANTGDTLTYQVTIRNTGTGNGYNLIIKDTLPEYVTDIRNISNNGVYDSNTRVIIWNNTTDPQGIALNNGQSVIYTFEVTIPNIMPVGTTILHNIATVENPTQQPVSGDDNTTVIALPKLDIEKYVKNLTAIEQNRIYNGNNGSYGADADTWFDNENDVRAIAGDVLEFTLVYRNTGNATSPKTWVADHLPRYILDDQGNQFEIIRGEDFISIDDGISPVQNGSAWDIIWNIGDFNVSEEYQVKKFQVRINPDSSVNYTTNDVQRILDNNSDIKSENPQVQSDEDNAVYRIDQPVASITKDSDKVIYQSNEKVIYEITVSNNGDAKAVGIVRDTLPEGMSYVSSNPTVARILNNVMEWDITLDAGQTTTIQITAKFNTPVKDGSFFDNKVVYIYENENKNDRPDVNAEKQVEAIAPIIEVVKEKLDPTVVTPLNIIKYTAKIHNVGKGTAFNASVTDVIDIKFLDVLPETISDGGTYDVNTHTITWNIGDLASNGNIVRTYEARIKFTDEIQNRDVIYNKVTVINDTTDNTDSNTVESEISCGYLEGIVWEDSDKDAMIDKGELRIGNAIIDVSIEDFDKYGAKFVTDKEGHYVATCLPYEQNISVDLIRPNGYVGQTTVDNYMVRLTESGDSTIYKLDENGNTLWVWAGTNFSHADLGLYRTKLSSGSVLGISTMSQTGSALLTAFLGMAFSTIAIYLGLHNRKTILNFAQNNKWKGTLKLLRK